MKAFTSRQFATEVAGIVGGKVKTNDRNVSGEPDATYRICIHTNAFWITARIADGRLVFSANHKRGCGEMILFAAAFRHPYQGFGRIYPRLTKSWGFPVFGCWEAEAEVAGLVLMDELRPKYRDWIYALEFERFHFCDIQIKAIVAFRSPEDAAHAIVRLRQFMLDVDMTANALDPEKCLTRR
jgi:hypothetical protein